MAWDPTIPATNADLLSAPVRDNFGALETSVMGALGALATQQVLIRAPGPAIGGVAAGADGQVLTLASGIPVWQTASTGGMSNPMTAIGDLILGSTAGAPARLGIGGTNQVLTVVAGTPAWTTPFSNPMTSIGDLILGGSGGTPTRLAAVATGSVLISAGVNTAPFWSTGPSVTSLTLGSGNLTMYGGAVGTSGAGVLAIGPSTAPTTSPVDTVQFYTEDYGSEAGSRSLVIRNERGHLTNIGSTAAGTNFAQSFSGSGFFITTQASGSILATSTNHPLELRTNNVVRMILDTTGRVDLPSGAGLYIGASDELRLYATSANTVLSMVPPGGHTYTIYNGGTGGGYGAGSWTLADEYTGHIRLQWSPGGSLYLSVDNFSGKYVSWGALDSGGAGFRMLKIAN
jgi:hypothetical protein